MMFNHKMKAVVNEIEMCAVGVKTNGQRASKFLSITIRNRDFMKIKLPGKILFANSVFISLAIIELILFMRINHLEVDLVLMENKNRMGNRIALHDKLKLDDEGSKIENKFIIMLS